MPRLPRRLLLIALIILCPIITIWAVLVIWNTDYGCFGMFFPTPAQIETRTGVIFPASMSNLKWRCFAGLGEDSIFLRFTIDPKDKEQFIKDTVGYNNWRSPFPKTLFFWV
ncbi:MAG TPA: hypothetical protein VHO69_13830 [Phototrophicaceae bacterium]|nr:hypothetical protein [Phototrophicaceae bacterium]